MQEIEQGHAGDDVYKDGEKALNRNLREVLHLVDVTAACRS